MTRFARLLLILVAAAAMLAPPHAGHGAGFDPSSMLCGPAKAALSPAQLGDLRRLAALTGELPDEAPADTLCDFACAAVHVGAPPPAPPLPLRRESLPADPPVYAAPASHGRPETATRASRAPPVRALSLT